VLTRLTPETHSQAPGYGSPYQTYPAPGTVVTPAADRMTIDDVVVKTVSLLAIVGVSGLATATLVPKESLFLFWMGGMIVGLILGLVISFKRIVNPPLIITYGVVQGAFLGAVSWYYNTAFDGIVLQAIIATFGIFFVMAALYKAKVLRATPKFTRGLIGAVIAATVLIVLRFLLQAFGVNNPLSDGSAIAIIVSLAIIVIGALTFILDFDLVEQAVAQGAPKNFAWYCAFGILLGLIWVYLEVLRLLSYLRGNE
jgi:uncharacterized YccA/Bax inhibitor family protein